ncbi:MAG: polynucleotide adenylyltransferase PcnB, partial [Victivallales bacterium]|nr:polynucleotide adenylyltransferase PcnB [Victivallales bacterium]
MNLRNKIRGSAIQVVKRLVDNGHEAYIVGGAVRDLLLGYTPKDVDITTSATPEQVREVFGRRQCIIIGRRFRLAHVRMGDEIYEVSTFRREPTAEERRGRLDDDGEMIWNDNQFGTLEDDAMRRDFTVNALYFDPIGERGIIDLVGGREDLKNKVVRVIGDAKTRFIEDPVRMLRALKLVGMYGFSMTQDTEEALKEKRG